MKNFISFNAKYYKNSNAQGEIGHVQRVFAENTNQIKELAKNNFGCGFDIYEKYKATYKQVEEIKGKKLQKNSNTFMDGVLSFSRDQMEEMMKGPNWKKDFSEHIEKYMEDVKEKTGLEPLGWEMHMDEGYKDAETGEIKVNYHAQLIFFNFDFKTHKAPLRDLMGRKGDSIWSKLQDVAADRFKDLGFVRGISADMTKAKHKEKDDFIAAKNKELEQKLEDLEKGLDDQALLLEEQQVLLGKIAENVHNVVENYNAAVLYIDNAVDIKEKYDEVKEAIKVPFNAYKNNPSFKGFVDKVVNFTKSIIPEKQYKAIEDIYKKVSNYFNYDFKKIENTMENIIVENDIKTLIKEFEHTNKKIEENKESMKKKVRFKP